MLSVLTFGTEDEAVELANSTEYGLGAGVWTNDLRRAHRVAHALWAGNVWVNSYRVVAPNVPFGGTGASGLGRESGADAAREYTETKANRLCRSIKLLFRGHYATGRRPCRRTRATIPGTQAIHVIEIIEAMYRSAQDRVRVHLRTSA